MNKSQQIVRAKQLLKNDRLNIEDGFDKLFLMDLKNFLRDFFDIQGEINVNINEQSGNYCLDINFRFDSIKNINEIK